MIARSGYRGKLISARATLTIHPSGDKGLLLIVFTSSYPFDFTAEYAFINPEIRRLVKNFEKIILIPRLSRGKILSLPAGVEVNSNYADFLQRNTSPHKMIGLALSAPSFVQEICRYPAVLLYPSKFLKLILFSARVELTKRWLVDLIETQGVELDHCILYSYWFDYTATGLAWIKQEHPRTKFISRAHGYDIYEEHYYPYYWPFRRETLEIVDTLFVASEAGTNYFRKRFPEYRSKFETAHLGTEDPGFTTKPSSDHIFRVVSCSYIVPVKRLNLLADGIAMAARLRPAQKFEWVHFGDGKGRKSLDRRIDRNIPSNVQIRFLGHVPNYEIMEYYRDNPCDVFVNVSRTEGGAPVSIQEAISCGIPVIATAVGGNPEIVSERNGILLRSDPRPKEIADAIFAFLDDQELATRKRIGSRAVWMEHYNAEVNFSRFAERLKKIGASS